MHRYPKQFYAFIYHVMYFGIIILVSLQEISWLSWFKKLPQLRLHCTKGKYKHIQTSVSFNQAEERITYENNLRMLIKKQLKKETVKYKL